MGRRTGEPSQLGWKEMARRGRGGLENDAEFCVGGCRPDLAKPVYSLYLVGGYPSTLQVAIAAPA